VSDPVDHGAPHVPVLLAEALAALAPIAGGVFVDGTFGAGGYTRAILEAGARKVVAIDRDPSAIDAGAALADAYGARLILVSGRFSDLDRHAADAGVDRADGVVLDIGVSSMQLDQAERGFSFRGDGPLDMRMGGDGPSAADIVNQLDAPELARILQLFGEERQAGRIARAIVRRRSEAPITRTGELVSVCESVLGTKRFGEAHPATRTFQALRIHVNGELDELVAGLAAAERLLSPGGRLAVVTFHSLEDRIVKRFFAERSRTTAQGSRHRPEETVPPATFTDVAKPTEPTAAESERNPRARSARLRHAVRTSAEPRDTDPARLGAPVLDVVHRRRRKSP
jgi:16S rRNA (cytosine1402-N4)-methyltransferase